MTIPQNNDATAKLLEQDGQGINKADAKKAEDDSKKIRTVSMWTEGPKWFIAIFFLLYATGFLVVTSYQNSYGLKETGSDFFKVRYIHIGILCLALPMIINGVFYGCLYLFYRHKDKDKNRESKKIIKTTWPGITASLLAIINLIAVSYIVVMFAGHSSADYSVFAKPLLEMHVVTRLGLLGILSFEWLINILGRNTNDERSSKIASIFTIVLRYLLLAYVIYLDCFILKPFVPIFQDMCISGFWLIAEFFIFTFLLGLLLCLASRDSLGSNEYSSKDKPALWVIAFCIIGPIFYLTVLSFAYGVFPYIPALRGGGDYSVAKTVILCLKDKPDSFIANYFLNDPNKEPVSRSKPLIIIEETATDMFFANPSDANGPMAWRTNLKPKLLNISRDRISSMIYNEK